MLYFYSLCLIKTRRFKLKIGSIMEIVYTHEENASVI